MEIVSDNSKQYQTDTCPKESFNWEHPQGCEETCKTEPFPNIGWNVYYKEMNNANF